MKTLHGLLALLTTTLLLAVASAQGPSAPTTPPSGAGQDALATPETEHTPLKANASKTVTITVRSSPRATVRWGKKTLGVTPLTFTRPRESGPVDLTLTAPSHLPMRTRAYTFTDDRVDAKLVRFEDRQTVFGYPHNLDAGLPDSAIPPSEPPPME